MMYMRVYAAVHSILLINKSVITNQMYMSFTEIFSFLVFYYKVLARNS